MSFPGRVAARLLILLLGAALALGGLGLAGPRPAGAVPAAPASQEPAAYISVNADTGAVIAARNEHTALPPASTIKLLTALVALERLPLSATVPVSARAAAQPAMKINMTEGSVWKLNDALHALLIVSANDAAYAIAERAGGSIEGFARLAQAEATRLGLVDTTFNDPAGLDDAASYGGGTTASAFDLAVVARNALSVPAIAQTAKLLRYDFKDPNGVGRTLTNHNKGFLTTYAGAIGLKTGYTKRANRTLVTAATRDGRTCLAVNMGTWDDTGWAGYLLDQCFAAGRDSKPTGTTLPPVRAVTADQRLDAYQGLPAALGRPALAATAAATGAPAKSSTGTSSTTSTTTTTRARDGVKAADRQARGTTVEAQAASATTAATGSGDSVSLGSVVSLRNLAIVVGLLALTVFLLRRRAVRRQRRRRIERQKALAEKRRRRMIDVVELRDRESGGHVRVMRSDQGDAGRRGPAR